MFTKNPPHCKFAYFGKLVCRMNYKGQGFVVVFFNNCGSQIKSWAKFVRKTSNVLINDISSGFSSFFSKLNIYNSVKAQHNRGTSRWSALRKAGGFSSRQLKRYGHNKVSVKGNRYSFVGLVLATVHLKLVTFLYSSAISTTRPSRQPSQTTLTSPVPGFGTGTCPPQLGHMTSNICPHHRCPHPLTNLKIRSQMPSMVRHWSTYTLCAFSCIIIGSIWWIGRRPL